MGFPGGSVVKTPPASAEDARHMGSNPGSGRSPRDGNGTHSRILMWEIPGQRSLVGYSPWGRKEQDTTAWLHTHTQNPDGVMRLVHWRRVACIYPGSPKQCKEREDSKLPDPQPPNILEGCALCPPEGTHFKNNRQKVVVLCLKWPGQLFMSFQGPSIQSSKIVASILSGGKLSEMVLILVTTTSGQIRAPAAQRGGLMQGTGAWEARGIPGLTGGCSDWAQKEHLEKSKRSHSVHPYHTPSSASLFWNVILEWTLNMRSVLFFF